MVAGQAILNLSSYLTFHNAALTEIPLGALHTCMRGLAVDTLGFARTPMDWQGRTGLRTGNE